MTTDAWWLVESARTQLACDKEATLTNFIGRTAREIATNGVARHYWVHDAEFRSTVRRLRSLGFTVTLTPIRQPFWDWVLFGKLRTEFKVLITLE